MTWLDDNPTDGLGGYRLLTGDTMTVTAAVSNTSETPNTYRIYLHLNDTDGSINLEPGTTYTFDEVEATCHATEDPATVYLEITPPTGSTVYAPITVGYPNHESDGGGVTIWGVELTREQAADPENDGLIIDATATTTSMHSGPPSRTPSRSRRRATTRRPWWVTRMAPCGRTPTSHGSSRSGMRAARRRARRSATTMST